MRYFSNFFEDRRMLAVSSSVDGSYSSSNRFELSQAAKATTNQQVTVGGTAPSTNPATLDSFTGTGSNESKISSAAQGTNMPVWGTVGATPAGEKTPATKAYELKFGTKIPRNEDGSINTEAAVQAVVDYYAGPEGGSMNLGGFSAERFANAGHDERMSMLRDMREQNDLAKAAKFEEDLRLAQERDAAKEAQNNPAAQPGGDITGKLIATGFSIFEKVLPMLF